MAMNIVVMLALGFAGALLGYRLALPAGVLVGVIVSMSVGTVLLGLPAVKIPAQATQALQVLVGVLVGLRISRDSLRTGLRSMIPAGLITGAMILTAVLSALVVTSLTRVDLATALFAAAPGGMTEMSAVGASYGANGATIVTVHLVRLLLAIIIVNALLGNLNHRAAANLRNDDPPSRPGPPPVKASGADGLRTIAVACVLGTVGGLGGLASQIPAGGVIGALVLSAAVRLSTPGSVPLRKFQFIVQGLSGAVIGLQVSGNLLGGLVHAMGIGAIVISAQLLLWLLTGYLLSKFFRYDTLTSIFTSAPGGMSELIATANQSGANTTVVAFAHLLRLSATIVIVPSLFVVLFSG